MTSAYPLTWPKGRERTPPASRREPRFRTGSAAGTKTITLPVARVRLSEEMNRIGARYTVLSTNLELRLDGQPRAGLKEPADPGAACWFRLRDRDTVLACDRWSTVAGNVAAIAAHIEAVRGQERWGVGSLEQAFAGFMALPAPANGTLEGWQELLLRPAHLAQAEDAYRKLIRRAHPDAGGSVDDAVRLNAAIAAARLHFGKT